MSDLVGRQESSLSIKKESNLFNHSTELTNMVRQSTSVLNCARPQIGKSSKQELIRSKSLVTCTRKDNFGIPIFKGNQKKYKLIFRDELGKNLCSIVDIKRNKNPNSQTFRKVVKKSATKESDDCSCFCFVF